MEAADDTHEAAKAFRKRSNASRHLLIAFVANIALAAAFLGVPYVRGREQAKTALHQFTRFAGCLLGAEPSRTLGLGLPQGEREHFAALVLRGANDWPARCKPALHAIAPAEAIFLWPSIKVAGGDVRAAVKLVDQELSTLARARALHPGQVPERPLLAVARLRAALALLAKAADADAEIDANAVTFKRPAAVTDPARLPIIAGSSAALEVWAGEDGLSALALDGRGVSVLRLEGGKIDHRRWKRTNQLRAALHEGGVQLLVWATPRARCEQDEAHCLRRATGIAELDPGAEQLPTPEWLSGHLELRADRGVRVLVDRRVDVVVRSDAQGMLEVRRFKLERPERDDAPPAAPLERFALPTPAPPRDALLLNSQPPALVYALPSADGIAASLVRYDANEAPIALGTLTGSGAFIAACDAAAARFVAFGTSDQLSIVRVPNQGAPTSLLSAAPIALGDPLNPEDRNHDRLRMLCSDDGASVIAATAARALITLACSPETCTQGPELASDVSAFDATLVGDTTLVAYARTTHPELLVQRLDARGHAVDRGQVPAACWEPLRGMCGQPTLVADAGRLLLCARDGSDLLALESEDKGQSWKPLSGLKVSGAIDTDADAVMRQHRKRKGLD